MLLMRVSLPRRPGALGAVATALGSLDADINLVEIVEKGPNFEIDEFILDLPTAQTIEAVVAVCDAVEGSRSNGSATIREVAESSPISNSSGG